jgi:hypothetical protein
MNTMGMVKGETKVLRFEIIEDGVRKDLTGVSFKFAVKLQLRGADYAIGPIDGVVTDPLSGEVSFTIFAPSALSGVYEIAMFGVNGAKTVLTPPNGLSFVVYEDIIDG